MTPARGVRRTVQERPRNAGGDGHYGYEYYEYYGYYRDAMTRSARM